MLEKKFYVLRYNTVEKDHTIYFQEDFKMLQHWQRLNKGQCDLKLISYPSKDVCVERNNLLRSLLGNIMSTDDYQDMVALHIGKGTEMQWSKLGK